MTVNRRPLRGSWGLGLALLVASTAGAIFVLHARGGPEPSRTAQTPDATYTGIPGSVTCYGTVDLDQGVAPLAPLQPGRVLDVKVKENQVVKKDDILLTLDDQLAQGRYQEALADLNAAKEQLKEAAKLPEQHQLKIEQQQAAVDAMKYRLAAATFVRDLKEKLAKNAIDPKEAAAAAEHVKELEAGVRAEEAKLKELKLVDPQSQLRRAEHDVAVREARVKQAKFAVDECVLKAPANGKVLQVLTGPGSVLGFQPGGPAAAIMFWPEDAPRIVRAEVEQEFADRLVIGNPAIIHDESSTTGTWHGKVARIADWYTRSRTNIQDPLRMAGHEVRILECLITLDPKEPPLRLGQRVRITTGKNLAGS